MKLQTIFENRHTGQQVTVSLDTARYRRAGPSTARVAACDALATAQHMLGADRPGDLRLCNARAL